jgi:hypothetical protein
MSKFLPTKDAATYCGMSGAYLLNQAKIGNVPYIQPSRKKIFFDQADLDIWMSKWTKFGETPTVAV